MQAHCEPRAVISRYVLVMKHFHFLPLLSVVALGAWAQPGVGRNAGAEPTSPQHRRAELRLILKEPRLREPLNRDPDQRFENVAYDRHLSAEERADLRQKLRQQRLDGKPPGP